MAIAPTPRCGSKSAADDLRELMAEHGLTQRDVAAMACVSIKTVEGWLADKAAASFRSMAPRHLALIRHTMPGYLAARGGRKAP
jgi:transcriptional regulator with XRE-family HTH domain